MNSDQLMYNINAAYDMDFNQMVTGKVFGDFNLPTGSDTSRFINLGLGAEVYANDYTIAKGLPYLTGDLGYAFTQRNVTEEQTDGLALGAGAGFKFQASQTNLDVNLHYSILTAQVQGNNPSVFGVRLAVNF
jgi:hypothetical protein